MEEIPQVLMSSKAKGVELELDNSDIKLKDNNE